MDNLTSSVVMANSRRKLKMNISINAIKLICTAICFCFVLSACNESHVAAGGAHTVAYKQGILYTWGRNDSNQVGNGETSRSVDTPISIELNLPKHVHIVDIKANLNFTTLLDSDGDVWVWGTNDQGQAGSGTVDRILKPTKIKALDKIFITDIGAGQRHVLAVSLKGRVWAWGNNGAGQLGIEVSDNNENILNPILVPNLKGIVEVEGGGAFSLAITQAGEVYAWGDNDNGQLAIDPIVVNRRHTPKLIDNIHQYVRAVSAGKDHAVALLYDGSMLSWGQNFSGQLGNGTNENMFTPSLIDTSGVKMQQISAAGNFTLAISTEGRLFSWVQNLLGSLGIGTEDSSVPLRVDFFNQPVIRVANGLGHTVVVTEEEDGSEAFWTFGLNSFGQIGIKDAPFANYIPQRVIFD